MAGSRKLSGLRRGLVVQAARQLAPKVTQAAPGLTHSFVREALHRAIAGIGPLAPAAQAAEAQLREQRHDVDRAVRELIQNHTAYASAEGLSTNLGGLVTAAFVAPASITGLALIQCRMVAGIAHLRGYDLADPRVRNAVLVTLLGDEGVRKLVKDKKLPAPPMAIATAPAHDPTLDRHVSSLLAGELIARVVGKRAVTTVGKRVPLVGGAVGAVSDGWATWRVGRYADAELLPLARR
ncbi:EcsC family protein [Nocardioides sp. zg-ZUI104]|uniref:EcsC family protein n=1 Tax=Nocardioides faecalis TaxID=2803858 RepID=UPI001BD19D5C|nr:EcsC family protein [Nocardioides faecalis]MBS4753050.1 EcsC family protein [Nocardioides faecalis]